jgi:hypothetical protein
MPLSGAVGGAVRNLLQRRRRLWRRGGYSFAFSHPRSLHATQRHHEPLGERTLRLVVQDSREQVVPADVVVQTVEEFLGSVRFNKNACFAINESSANDRFPALGFGRVHAKLIGVQEGSRDDHLEAGKPLVLDEIDVPHRTDCFVPWFHKPPWIGGSVPTLYTREFQAGSISRTDLEATASARS